MNLPKSTSILIATLALVACSGVDAAPAITVPETSPPTATTEPTTTTTPTTTTAPATTTTAAPTTTTAAPTTTTTIPPEPVMPLTGLPVVDPAIAARPAVVVKIANDKKARPQSGLDSADIVFEAWGAGPTRFATVFQSKDAPNVGPIRSARTQDIDLVGSFNGAVFACSGGNRRVVDTIRASDLLVLSEGQGPGWRLDKKRRRPHATYNDTASLRMNADPSRPGPAQQFHYRPVDVAAAGDPSAGFNLHIQSVRVEWRFVAESNSYARSQDGGPHLLADGTPVQFNNVVVLWINYEPSPADARSPDGGTIGSGSAVVFTNGKVTAATWSRDDRLKPIALTDSAGSPVLLTAGTTWFELANTGQGGFPGTDELEILPA